MQQRLVIATEDRAWIEKYGWRSVEDVLACASEEVAAVSRTSDVVHVPIDAAMGGPGSVFVKRYLYHERSQRIKQMFRGTLFGKSRARIEYEFLQEMCSRQVPTVRPIAYGEIHKWGFLRESFIITEGMEGGQSLDIFAIHARRNRMLAHAAKMSLIRGLATIIRRMHDAGVQHGGLFWRNILVREQADGGYDFSMLDPDSGARLFTSQVPLTNVMQDLSAFVASAMALDVRGGLRSFMCAYYQVTRLTSQHRQMIARVVEHARPLASQERRRMAVTEAIDWFRDRVKKTQRQSESMRTFASLDEFFDVSQSCESASGKVSKKKLTFQFLFSDSDQAHEKYQRCVVIESGRVVVSSSCASKPDMVIHSDAKTWLTLISGRADAYVRLRAGRLRMQGDTSLLPILVEYIDELSQLATSNVGK